MAPSTCDRAAVTRPSRAPRCCPSPRGDDCRTASGVRGRANGVIQPPTRVLAKFAHLDGRPPDTSLRPMANLLEASGDLAAAKAFPPAASRGEPRQSPPAHAHRAPAPCPPHVSRTVGAHPKASRSELGRPTSGHPRTLGGSTDLGGQLVKEATPHRSDGIKPPGHVSQLSVSPTFQRRQGLAVAWAGCPALRRRLVRRQ